MNIISVIPDMLKNSVLVQTENNGANKTHILVSKVRYGNERFAVGLVINENNGKFFYDHEMTETEALADSVREETRVEPAKASVNRIIQKVLLSSGFDVNSEKNLHFSIAPVDGDGFVSTADREKMITVLMGIPQQQLDNMDGAAALDYLTQKQFKVPSDWLNLC